MLKEVVLYSSSTDNEDVNTAQDLNALSLISVLCAYFCVVFFYVGINSRFVISRSPL
jgi:hypothetical protein